MCPPGRNEASQQKISNNRNSRKRCEICSKLTKKTPEDENDVVFIVNFEHTSHPFPVFLLLNLKTNLVLSYTQNIRPEMTCALDLHLTRRARKFKKKIGYLKSLRGI